MPKLRFPLPSPAVVISMLALSLVLGGTAVAASTATPSDTKADTKLVKKLAPALSVKHATSADQLGGAPASSYARASSLSFTAPALANNWNAAGSGFGAPGYTKDQFGTVHLAGAVGHVGASGAVIFTLPAGYRPAASVDESAVFVGPAVGVIRINTNGDVLPYGGTTTFVDLDGINFQAGS